MPANPTPSPTPAEQKLATAATIAILTALGRDCCPDCGSEEFRPFFTRIGSDDRESEMDDYMVCLSCGTYFVPESAR